jgi:hypothetical protein
MFSNGSSHTYKPKKNKGRSGASVSALAMQLPVVLDEIIDQLLMGCLVFNPPIGLKKTF